LQHAARAGDGSDFVCLPDALKLELLERPLVHFLRMENV